MHQEHPVFQAPSNLDIPIWRYMDLAKFLSIVQAQALIFTRVDTMSDEFEGSITRPTLENMRSVLSEHVKPDEKLEEFLQIWRSGHSLHRNYSYLSCWHMSEYESAAMWSIYQSGEPQGIAIRSTYRRLVESITDQRPIWIGKVHYINFDTDILPAGNVYYPYVCKRRSFGYEREIRAFYPGEAWAKDGENSPSELAPIGPPVVPIATDLDRLVKRIYVSPKAKPWFADVIRDALQQYGRSWEVHHSNLDKDPIR